MEFIDENGTLNCEKLKKLLLYPAFAGEFEEDIDIPLCKLTIEEDTHVTLTVKEAKVDAEGNTLFDAEKKMIFQEKPYVEDGVEQTVSLFSLESKGKMEKILNNISNGSINRVSYSARRGNVGRIYRDEYVCQNPSLTTISRNMRNTLYHYQGWVDFDFVASHPSIVSLLAKKWGILFWPASL